MRESEASLEEQLRGFFDSSSIGMALVSREGAVLRANRELSVLLGYGIEELVGRPLLDFAHPIERPAETAALERLVAGTLDVHQRELRFVARSGETPWVVVTASPIRGADGDVVALAVQVRDVRTRKTTELALRASERRFRLLAVQAPIGIFEADADGRIVFVNERFSAVTGVSAPRAAGRPWTDGVHPEDLPALVAAWTDAALSGREFAHEFRFVRHDGRVVWAYATARAVKGESGESQNYLGTLVDVTDRRAAADALLQAKEAAEAAARTKAEFVARMSHEVRTPLNSILGMTRLALDTSLTAEQRSYLDVVQASGAALLRLVEDVLDFSKVGSGKLRLEPVDFDLHECVEKVVWGLSHRAAEKGLTLEAEFSPGCPRFAVGDAARLQQVLVNLVANAVKFTEQGGVSVAVGVIAETVQGALVEFAVTDTGIGIAPGHVLAIFEPFTQADEGVSRKYGGTGLGLAISAELATLMGGRLFVESAAGSGSTFRFTVPLGWSAGVPAPSTCPSSAPPPARARLLVVEDNETNRRLMAAMLGRDGHDVLIAGTGAEALALLEAESVDLVFMDVQMPGMSGFEVTRRLRAREAETGGHLPVVAVTAQAMPEDRERCLAAGMDAYLSKPVARRELQHVIATLGPGRSKSEAVALPSPSAGEPFDRVSLLRRIGGESALLEEISELFHRDALDLLRRLAVHAERRETVEATRAAHQLKGMLHNLSATPAATIAREIENLAEDGQWSSVLVRVRDLGAEVARVEAALRERRSVEGRVA
ncbi:MAG TPA: PAS domain S-box protein [Polyangiaceae bacterium]|nr:PAS domain S-box protein [Polyangiaceae bacterium]